MFSFYGGKRGKAKKYPKPKHDLIIEPFAGAAGYSYIHWDKKVVLVEKDIKIYSIWDYLINHATEQMILDLPSVDGYKVKLEDVQGFSQLSDPEKWLIGFSVNNGSAQPKNVSASTGNFNSWERDRIRITRDLFKIKHWKIFLGDYTRTPDLIATFFIDPPYQNKGKWYVHSSKDINYEELAGWCKARKGQTIVCENSDATWLPFKPLMEIPFSHYKTDADKKRKTVEAIWYNES